MSKHLFRGVTARALAGLALAVVAGFASTGCRSLDQPYSASFASVEIKDRTIAQIQDAASAVFRADGYAVAPAGPQQLVCNKEGSRMNKFAYGDWIGEAGVIVRVKVEIVPLASGACRLQCNAYMVRDSGDEVKLANVRRRPFQDLLDAVANKLK